MMGGYTYQDAKLIVWNYDMFPKDEARKAAMTVLANANARSDDIQQASHVLVRLPKGRTL